MKKVDNNNDEKRSQRIHKNCDLSAKVKRKVPGNR